MAYNLAARWKHIETLMKGEVPYVCISEPPPPRCFRLNDEESTAIFALKDIKQIEKQKELVALYLDEKYKATKSIRDTFPDLTYSPSLAELAYAHEVLVSRERRLEEPLSAFPGDTRLSPLDSVAPIMTEAIEIPVERSEKMAAEAEERIRKRTAQQIEELGRYQKAIEERRRADTEAMAKMTPEMLREEEKKKIAKKLRSPEEVQARLTEVIEGVRKEIEAIRSLPI